RIQPDRRVQSDGVSDVALRASKGQGSEIREAFGRGQTRRKADGTRHRQEEAGRRNALRLADLLQRHAAGQGRRRRNGLRLVELSSPRAPKPSPNATVGG